MTAVVNIRHQKYDVYIGRGSPFGNPFVISKDGNREEVIEKYRRYFNKRILSDKQFKKEVLELKDKVLGCYCKPLPCHGDVIVTYLDNIPEVKSQFIQGLGLVKRYLQGEMPTLEPV